MQNADWPDQPAFFIKLLTENQTITMGQFVIAALS
jgi:hypothetical protein